MNPYRLILASASPRRQAFLHALGLDVTILSADIDETPIEHEPPAALAARLATAKARAIAERLTEQGDLDPALIIAADTVVALGDQLLGKPTDAADARAMLAALRGREHQVVSAVSLLDRTTGRRHGRVNSTLVRMRLYTNAEIDAYIASGDPFDKAGAYAIQHPGFHPVCAIDGCIAGVMGLPLADLRDLLAEFGVAAAAPLPPICQGQSDFLCCQVAAQQTIDC